MKQIHLLFLTIISSIAISVSAQNQIQNGSFEAWSGIDHPTPDGWSSPGEMDGKKPGMWVTQESRHAYVRTGVYSLKLSVDTIQRLGGFNDAFRISTSRDNATSRVSERDSASARFGYFYIPGIVAAGRSYFYKNRVESTGIPVNGRPATLSFYIRTDHPVADTASVRLLLTRWNSRGYEDTVAYERADVYPDSTTMTGFALFTDTIHYLLLGDADTARIIVYGGRTRNSKAARANTTWIDGMSFGYGLPTPLRGSALADSLWLTPNPVNNYMNVKCDSAMQGYTIVIFDETGIVVKEIILSELSINVDMTDLLVGYYNYGLFDRDQRKVRDGYISVLRN